MHQSFSHYIVLDNVQSFILLSVFIEICLWE